jgi:plastocyanin
VPTAVAAIAFGVAACSSGPPVASAPPAQRGSAAPNHISVTIKNFAFSPSVFAVAPGATVTVTNRDSVTHTFTSVSSAFSSGDIGPGQSTTVTAPSAPGRYRFRCNIHQFMTGMLVVR